MLAYSVAHRRCQCPSKTRHRSRKAADNRGGWPLAIGLAGGVQMRMLACLALVLAACGSDPCLLGCGDDEYCASGTCRSFGLTPDFFCQSYTPQPGDLACLSGQTACGRKPTGGSLRCCPSDRPYNCEGGPGCYRTPAEAQKLCPSTCSACVGAAGIPSPACAPGTCRCTRIGACCPEGAPHYACGKCFVKLEDAMPYCYAHGTRILGGGDTDTCSC
jgi:hypothetical protein